MKKIIIILTLASVFFIIPMLVNPVLGQTAPKEGVNTLIPEDAMKIFERSCTACHSTGGSGIACSKVNFANWDKYSAEKQANKAQNICDEVTKGKMPPKKYISSHPDAVQTEADIKIICDWAQSLQKK